MQSIYFFRDADAELFPRVEQLGLEIPGDLPLRFDPVHLTANFRTAPPLVASINEISLRSSPSTTAAASPSPRPQPARDGSRATRPASRRRFRSAHAASPRIHARFAARQLAHPDRKARKSPPSAKPQSEKQIEEIVDIVRSHLPRIEAARAASTSEKVLASPCSPARANRLCPSPPRLRQASIPFRAVDLEELEDRPEIIDALALARALLNPHDRVAWLGVLRAPWCGLSLADLHALTSADSPELLARPVPELLSRARASSQRRRPARRRSPSARSRVRPAPALHAARRHAGHLARTGLAPARRRAMCRRRGPRQSRSALDAASTAFRRANPIFSAPRSLRRSTISRRSPIPHAASDCGVQLMTIHGAKGLEFEVVLVPDLQAPAGRGSPNMLSWLERGLPPEPSPTTPNRSGELTEFLVAPFQSEGRRPRQSQGVGRPRPPRTRKAGDAPPSLRRRHARPRRAAFLRAPVLQIRNGAFPPNSSSPRESLLATAWPAWQAEIQRRFREWATARTASPSPPSSNRSPPRPLRRSRQSARMSRPSRQPTRLRRLPAGLSPRPCLRIVARCSTSRSSAPAASTSATKAACSRARSAMLFTRSSAIRAASRLATARTALAALAEAAAPHRRIHPRRRHRACRSRSHRRAGASDCSQSRHRSARAVDSRAARRCRQRSPLDRRRQRQPCAPCRSIASSAPAPRHKSRRSPANEDTWWIVDYKTAHEDGLDPAAALPELCAALRAADRSLRSRPAQPPRRRYRPPRRPLLSAHGSLRLVAALVRACAWSANVTKRLGGEQSCRFRPTPCTALPRTHRDARGSSARHC